MAPRWLVTRSLATLPVLYHLLWKQQVVVDLAVVLSHRTIVRTSHCPADLAEVAEPQVSTSWTRQIGAEFAGNRHFG